MVAFPFEIGFIFILLFEIEHVAIFWLLLWTLKVPALSLVLTSIYTGLPLTYEVPLVDDKLIVEVCPTVTSDINTLFFGPLSIYKLIYLAVIGFSKFKYA